MDIFSRISTLLFPAIFLSFIAFSTQTFGFVGASIHPADVLDTVQTFTDPNGPLLVNPNLDPVNSNEDYSHTTHIEVDQNSGFIKGYSGYRLDTARSITRTDNLISSISGTNELALVANTSGSIIYQANVGGSPSGGQSSITLFIDVEGSFNYEVGAPAFGLLGSVSISVFPGGNFFNGVSYLTGGQYLNLNDQNFIPNASNIFTDEKLQVLDAFGNAISNPDLTGVVSDIEFLSSNPSALRMRVSLTVPISNDDLLSLGGTASGSATHAFLEDFRLLNVGDTGDVSAARGSVDFLNTASLSIRLSEGLTLEGEDTPPANIILPNSLVVPIPMASVWILLLTMLGITVHQYRQKK